MILDFQEDIQNSHEKMDNQKGNNDDEIWINEKLLPITSILEGLEELSRLTESMERMEFIKKSIKFLMI